MITQIICCLFTLLCTLYASPQHDYAQAEKVPTTLNALIATGGIPYDPYNKRLHFCQPKQGKKKEWSSIGAIVFGERVYNAPFELVMMHNTQCELLCNTTIPKEDAYFIHNLIKEGYSHEWSVDSLPAGQWYITAKEEDMLGPIPVGTYVDGIAALNTHFQFDIDYEERDGSYAVVQAAVRSWSTKSSVNDDGTAVCGVQASKDQGGIFKDGNSNPLVITTDRDINIVYTYGVTWKKNTEITYKSRWRSYFRNSPRNQVYWLELLSSLLLIIALSGLVGVILLKNLNSDIARYNRLGGEDGGDDSGWKLLHGDVFRSPKNAIFFSVLIGNGVQLSIVSGVTILMAAIGLISPSDRGALATVMFVTYSLSGFAAGYISAVMYKMFGGESWKKCVAFTALLVPGSVFAFVIFMNFFLIGSGSSGAIPFFSLFGLLCLWLLLSAPLCSVGSYFGFKKQRIAAPVRTNQIPRQIPPPTKLLRLIPSLVIGGWMPAFATSIEMWYILDSLWTHQSYHVFGMLFLAYLVLIIVCSQVSVLLTYFSLCAENHRWWWRSFFVTGASGIFLFLLSMYYFHTQVQVRTFASVILFFGWTAMLTVLWTIMTGTFGFLACFLFVRKIYTTVRVD